MELLSPLGNYPGAYLAHIDMCNEFFLNSGRHLMIELLLFALNDLSGGIAEALPVIFILF